MRFTNDIVNQFREIETPFYYYDLELLESTLKALSSEASKHEYTVHYALKANSNPKILELISNYGFGADCVSGNEITRALATGFDKSSIVFAGVGKTDKEIITGLDNDIHCFNCESIAELHVINELAGRQHQKARVALRINPNVEAHTHEYITTGLEENKFGIGVHELDQVLETLKTCTHLELIGIHFHIGSQITDLSVFEQLCLKVNEVIDFLDSKNVRIEHINLGGGLGINYENPDAQEIPDFKNYFDTISRHLKRQSHHQVHFELGRSVVAQCGSLISRVTFIKEGQKTNFAILDAGMTELMRPALYQSSHKIETLTFQNDSAVTYDIVGPICESSDSFGKGVSLNTISRGDLIAIRSAGAYGETMISNYNLRDSAKSYFLDADTGLM